MGFWSGVGSSVFKGIKPLAKGAVGGTVGRMGVGALAGATYGAITNPYDNPNMGLGWIAKHAAYGGALGGLSRLVTPAIRFTGKGIRTSGMPAAFRVLPSVTRMAYRGSRATATGVGLAMKYPSIPIAAGLGMMTVGAAAALIDTQTSPIQNNSVSSSVSNLQIRTEDAMIDQMDNRVAPGNHLASGASIRVQQMMQSTHGLVQGLHSGRHS